MRFKEGKLTVMSVEYSVVDVHMDQSENIWNGILYCKDNAIQLCYGVLELDGIERPIRLLECKSGYGDLLKYTFQQTIPEKVYKRTQKVAALLNRGYDEQFRQSLENLIFLKEDL